MKKQPMADHARLLYLYTAANTETTLCVALRQGIYKMTRHNSTYPLKRPQTNDAGLKMKWDENICQVSAPWAAFRCLQPHHLPHRNCSIV